MLTAKIKIANYEKLQETIDRYQKALEEFKKASWDLNQFGLEIEIGE